MLIEIHIKHLVLQALGYRLATLWSVWRIVNRALYKACIFWVSASLAPKWSLHVLANRRDTFWFYSWQWCCYVIHYTLHTMTLLCLSLHTTYQTQLLDVGVFSSLKSHWTNVGHDYFHSNTGKIITKFNFKHDSYFSKQRGAEFCLNLTITL